MRADSWKVVCEKIAGLERERDAALKRVEHLKLELCAPHWGSRTIFGEDAGEFIDMFKKVAELRAAYAELPANTRDRWAVEAGWIGNQDRRMAASVRALVEPVADAPEEKPAPDAPPLKVSVWKHHHSPVLTFSLAGDSLPLHYSHIGEYELRPAREGDRG